MRRLLPTPKHVELLELAHGLIRGQKVWTADGLAPIDSDVLAKRINDYLNQEVNAHGHDCWSWGPTHYMCAYREIKLLQKDASNVE